MPDLAPTVGSLADEIRAKNAGPFWLTLDIFLRRDEDYELLIASGVLTPDCLSGLYGVPADQVQIFELPLLRAVKIPSRAPSPLAALMTVTSTPASNTSRCVTFLYRAGPKARWTPTLRAYTLAAERTMRKRFRLVAPALG